MTPLVVDASVAYKWTVPGAAEDGAVAAAALLWDHVLGRVGLSVPALLLWEVGNILVCGAARAPTPVVAEQIARLHHLGLAVAVPSAEDARRTARLARDLGLTFYDAAYVALADSLGCDLVTADRRLARRAARAVRVRMLGTAGEHPG